MNEVVENIPISQIRILNPRYRDKKKFEKVVESIRTVGLKKPIKISRRITKDGEEPGYDLICGQGRIEAFLALGRQEIPAVIVEVSKDERLIMSLVENMARRFPSSMELITEIERLKSENYSNAAIARKLGVSDSLISGYITLSTLGEERLLNAVLKGKIPINTAIEIAKVKGAGAQEAFLKAYENNQLNKYSIRTVKRLIDQRQALGKSLKVYKSEKQKKTWITSAESVVDTLRKENQRRNLMNRKAQVCHNNLMILKGGFKKILIDDSFVRVLQSEKLATYPKVLSEMLKELPV